jgi:hypothetical protein
MAIYRKVHTSFWGDPFIETLTPEQKYFYLYLLTNEKTRQCGIYEISLRQMSFDTGYNQETVDKLIKFFEKSNKIRFSKNTNEIAIKNWSKHNDSTSPKVQQCVNKELADIKNRVLIQYLYSMDTHPQEEQEEAKEETKEQEEVPLKNQRTPNEFYEIFKSWFLGSFGFDFVMQKKDWVGIASIKSFCETNAISDPASSWLAVLSKYNTLPPFYQQNKSPAFIGSRMSEIVAELKKPSIKKSNQESIVDMYNDLKNKEPETIQYQNLI